MSVLSLTVLNYAQDEPKKVRSIAFAIFRCGLHRLEQHHNSLLFYSNRKDTGMVKSTGTAVPSSMPGFQLGMALITRTASASNDGCFEDRATTTSVIFPVSETTNCTPTLPSSLCDRAVGGYWRCADIHSCMFPTNSGI